MNLLHPWNAVFFVGLVVYFWIRYVYVARTKGETKAVSRFGRLEKWLLGAMFVPVLLLPLLYLFTPLLAFADYRLPAVAPWVGLATMVGSL